jgi:vitamin B12 transporter
MRRGSCRLTRVLAGALAAAVVLLARTPIVAAITEAEQTFLGIYFTPEELHVVSTTRSLKSINRIAENVQVISAADIALLQAHTLAEVLETVPGLAIENRGMSGSVFSPYIQGSSYTQVAAFLDGIRLNSLGSNFPELTTLPVEEIARIEVIKGPASSAWGSALGGVINIITKNPPAQPGHSGAVSASAGKDETTDLRANVTGRAGAVGYGVWAGRLHSNGLVDGYEVERNSVTAKLDYRSNPAWNAGLALYWSGSDRGEGLYPDYDEADRSESNQLRVQLTAEGLLPAGGQLSFDLWGSDNDFTLVFDHLSDGTEFFRSTAEDRMVGSNLRYRRSIAGHELVLGGDFLSGRYEDDALPGDVTEKRWALFGNDTFDIGKVTFTAGLRWDELKRIEPFWSPSLGAVCPVGGHLLLRAYVGRGFTAPGITSGITSEAFGYVGNPDLDVENVTSYQAGVEGDVPGLFWYKLTIFRHDVEDAIVAVVVDDAGNWTYVNQDQIRRKGLEIEARSVEFHGFVLEAGGSVLDVDNLTRGEDDFSWFADYTYRLALSYTGPQGLRALLNVHATHWNMPEGFDPPADPAYDPIVDLHVAKEFKVAGAALEVFGTGHNLFDGDQYYHFAHPNPGRWLEAGLKYRF